MGHVCGSDRETAHMSLKGMENEMMELWTYLLTVMSSLLSETAV